MLEPLIANVQSTTFFGQRLSRRQIAENQEVVQVSPQLSYTDLGRTLCASLRWQSPKGRNRIQRAPRRLESLEPIGILRLHPKRSRERPRQQSLMPALHAGTQLAVSGPMALVFRHRVILGSTAAGAQLSLAAGVSPFTLHRPKPYPQIRK